VPNQRRRLEGFIHYLASKQFAITLFLLLCISLVLKTLTKTTDMSLGWLTRMLFAGMMVNLLLCTAQRIRTLSRPVLVMHVGTLIVFAGANLSSLGYVATVNVYEGGSVESAYRWDLKRDDPLGYTLTVRRINREFYPVALQVGVMEGERKEGLFRLRTGESFTLGRYRVAADALDSAKPELWLTIFQGGRSIGRISTAGERKVPSDFPYDFRLVAFRKPVLKRAWIDLALSQGNRMVVEGTSEVNRPLAIDGRRFYFVQYAADDYGSLYAGIQIVKDPGTPLVYAGFVVVMAGTLYWMYRKLTTPR
jgi:hypothetical protein